MYNSDKRNGNSHHFKKGKKRAVKVFFLSMHLPFVGDECSPHSTPCVSQLIPSTDFGERDSRIVALKY